MGSGTYGSVALWVKHDTETNNVLDRIAIKTCDYAGGDDAVLWPDWPQRIAPSEVVAMRTLNRYPACPYIVKYLGWRHYPAAMTTYRVAMPAAELGDAYEGLLKWSAKDDEGRRLTHPNQTGRPFPSIFLFDLLAAWMTAGQHMHGRNVMHCDLKLENILMEIDDGNSAMTEFAPSPSQQQQRIGKLQDRDQQAGPSADKVGWGFKPIITDLGCARPQRSDRFSNPEDFINWGTPGYLPAEQVHDGVGGTTRHSLTSHYHDEDEVYLTQKATVYAIAATMFRVSYTTLPRLTTDH